MKTEIDHGVEFLCTLLLSNGAPEDKSRAFCDALRVVLLDHFNNHWDVEQPQKGSGYRCIRIHHDRAEPLVDRAALSSHTEQVVELLPSELTLWFDPTNVSYRIGENGGRIKTIYYAGSKDIPQPGDGSRLAPLLSQNSPPHTSQGHMFESQTSRPQPPQQQLHHHSPVYVPNATQGMGGRNTPAFAPRSPPRHQGMAEMYSPYSKQSANQHHNPHNLLMAAR